MKNINLLLNEASKELFRDLDEYHWKILERLATFGAMGLVELGRDLRWQMKLRLYGSNRTIGLIPNDFVHEFKISNKKVNYELTTKGLLAVLAIKKFEDVYTAIKYKEFLEIKLEKKDLVNWSFEFIKYEIALILYYNYLQGLNWTKFKNIKPYWTDYKTYSNHVRKNFFMHEFLNKDISEEYKMIESKYLTLFSILDYCTFTIRWDESSSFSDLLQFPADDSIRIYVDRWHLFIDDRNLREQDVKMLIIEWGEQRENNMLLIDEYFELKVTQFKKQAKEILRRNGYDIAE